MSTNKDDVIGASEPPKLLPNSYVQYALWVLLIIYTLNFVDRQIVGILAGPIKKDLGISDGQLGMLIGLAFAFFYTLLGLPIARLAERGNRPLIISTAVIVWSGFTALCGVAQNFTQLLLARIGVGVGEAGCTPPAHSLISDYVPAERRASAIAFYSLGVPVGTALGYVVGAWIAQHYGWRTAFFAVGIPGLLIGLVALMTLKEPRKLGLVTLGSASTAPGLVATAKELTIRKSYWYAVGAATTISFLGYGHASFLPIFLARVHGMALGDIGTAMAAMTFIAGGAGTLLGGMAADRAAKSDTRAYMTVPLIAFICGIPFFWAAMFTGNTLACILLIGIPTLLNAVWYGPVYAAVQSLVRPQSRATAVALMLFVVNMIGLGAGPTAVGFLSDMFASQHFATIGPAGSEFASYCAKGAATAASAQCGAALAEGIRWSLLASGSVGLLVILFFMLARRTISQDLIATADQIAADEAAVAAAKPA